MQSLTVEGFNPSTATRKQAREWVGVVQITADRLSNDLRTSIFVVVDGGCPEATDEARAMAKATVALTRCAADDADVIRMLVNAASDMQRGSEPWHLVRLEMEDLHVQVCRRIGAIRSLLRMVKG